MREERKIINTNIRLNLMDEQDKKAWEYLQTMDREKYKSYTRAVVMALNDYFDREYRREADPYLETREKEDAFLERVVDAVKEGAEESMPMVLAKNLLGALQPMMEKAVQNRSVKTERNASEIYTGIYDDSDIRASEKQEQEEAVDAALDFADSF